MRTVIFLCDKSGIAAKPWAEAGFECWCIDIQHSIRATKRVGNVVFQWGDVRTWSPPLDVLERLVFLAAFPPCTHVAVSGARDFRTKGTGLLRDSLELFSACEHAAKWAGAPYFLENSVGKFSDHMGKPDFVFQPWEYGDLWTKATCLWTGNGFVMPLRIHATPPEGVTAKIWKMAPSSDRADLRSETPAGFARAVFAANVPESLANREGALA